MTDTQHTHDTTPTSTASEFDFDAWLSGAERTARYVTLYSNGELLAKLARVNAALETIDDGKDRALGDASAATLRAEANRLREDLKASSREFRVEASIEDEVEAVRAAARKATAEARKKAVDAARTRTIEDAQDLGLSAKEEHEAIIRETAQASDDVVGTEVAMMILAERVQVKRQGRWTPIGRQDLDRLKDRLGDPQILKLREAWDAARTDRPEELTVPSSPER